MDKVVVYQPGAIVGIKLRECCSCSCHRSMMIHFAPCCQSVKGFSEFPKIDEYGRLIDKLPECPNCQKDELSMSGDNLVSCRQCGWKLVKES